MALAAAVGMVTLFLIIYLPDVGHGFISDDFGWIAASRLDSVSEAITLFTSNTGFYRPVVVVSFAVDHAVWGTNAFGYGLANVTLCLLAAAMLFALARLGMPVAAALTATGAWLFNFHAVNMAVLWLSGRTSLLASLFSLATALAVFQGRPIIGGLLCLLAMLSKEEAVLLPPLFTAFHVIDERRLRSMVRTWPLWAAFVGYVALRFRSGAFWPTDAPSYYSYSFSPGLVGENILEYADRAGTMFAVIAIALLVAGRIRSSDFTRDEWRVIRFAALWIVAAYAPTVLLPQRSSLYALLPSIGSALIVGVVAAAAGRRQPARARTVAVALIVAVVVLVPVYRSRNVRWVRLAELSEHVLDTIRAAAGRRPAGHVVLIDSPAERFNLASAFGGLYPEAMQLHVGTSWTAEVVSTPDEAQRPADLAYRLANGVLVPLRSP
jgi:hypothetical protein